MSQGYRTPKTKIGVYTENYSDTELRIALKYLTSLGVDIFYVTLTTPHDPLFPILYWAGDKLSQRKKLGHNEISPVIMTLLEFISEFEIQKEIIVKLNDQYSASVTEKEITVGCQTFSHAVIEELYNASVAQKPKI
jgi:hypothetical protein